MPVGPIRRRTRAGRTRRERPPAALSAEASSVSGGGTRPQETPQRDDADGRPDPFEQDESRLAGGNRHDEQERRPDRVQQVIGGDVASEASGLVRGVCDEDEERSQQRGRLERCPAQASFSMRAPERRVAT
jgi:hypothetical protein